MPALSPDGSPRVGSRWSTRATFLLAAIGAAVGLGNIWKFPYLTGTEGGSAFVLVYLLCAFLIAIPILIAEMLLGKYGRGSPPLSVRRVAAGVGGAGLWSIIGWLGVIAGYLILSYYSVIGGWALAYVGHAATGVFGGISGSESTSTFDALMAQPWTLLGWHTAFMLATTVIIGRGLERGIEVAVRFLMPALFVMLLMLVGYAAFNGAFGEALSFLFAPDFSKLSADTLLTAIGQAFFSIGVAMGLMMAYGSYLPDNVRIGRTAVVIALADTGVALLAGLAIFPLVFANGLDPADGAGLLFTTLPVAFGAMPFGDAFATVFFVLLVFAALTSAIAILEPLVSRGIEWAQPAAAPDPNAPATADRPPHRASNPRPLVAALAGFGAWAIGILSVLSFNVWSDVKPLGDWLPLNWFDLIDYITANIMMPLGGLLMAVFVGYRLRADFGENEFGEARWAQSLWRTLLRYVAPVGILAIFVSGLI